MLTISVYKNITPISEDENFQAMNIEENKPVLLRLLRNEYLTNVIKLRTINDDKIRTHLDLDSIVRILSIDEYEGKPLRVSEDFGGNPLSELIKTQSFLIQEVIDLGIKIATILGKIHKKNVIHKCININNIIYN